MLRSTASKRARSNWPVMPLKPGSSVICRAISASLTLSRNARAPLVERGFGDHLAEQLPVEAQRPGLVGQDRPVQLAAELLQPVLVELAELLDADFGAADLGDGRRAEAAENVADAPDAEADGDQAEDHAHDGAADPIGGGFVNTSKHETVSCCLGERPRFRADWAGI